MTFSILAPAVVSLAATLLASPLVHDGAVSAQAAARHGCEQLATATQWQRMLDHAPLDGELAADLGLDASDSAPAEDAPGWWAAVQRSLDGGRLRGAAQRSAHWLQTSVQTAAGWVESTARSLKTEPAPAAAATAPADEPTLAIAQPAVLNEVSVLTKVAPATPIDTAPPTEVAPPTDGVLPESPTTLTEATLDGEPTVAIQAVAPPEPADAPAAATPEASLPDMARASRPLLQGVARGLEQLGTAVLRLSERVECAAGGE